MTDPHHDEPKATQLNAGQLRGKQSVRATFRLPDQMIDLLKVAAVHLGVKQKSLIDQLVEDRDILDQIAREVQSPKHQVPRRQKTFVLSRKALTTLDTVSEAHGISRDTLVERSIQRLIPFVDGEQEKHRKRRRLLQEVEDYLVQGKKLLDQAGKMLGREDSFRGKLEKIVDHTERNIEDLRKFVKEKNTLQY